jgi:hypothetical protein
MKLKYSTDEYGNVYSNVAQIDQVDGSVLFNDRVETLDIPVIPDKGKRLIVENGKWSQIPISIEHVKDGDRIRPKTQVERYATGVDDIPKGMKLSDDKKELLPKTLDEQLSSGEITQAEYKEIVNAPIKSELEIIDAKSVRSLREWLLTQNGCPEFLKTYDKEATAKRLELKK